MGRPTNEASMQSIATLRPDEALHPRGGIRSRLPGTLGGVCEIGVPISSGIREQGAQLRLRGLRRRGAKVGRSRCCCHSRRRIHRSLDRNQFDKVTHDPTQCLASRRCDLPDHIREEAATSPNRSEAITCPTASTCYLEADGKGGITGYKSVDGGLNWASLAISDVSLSTRLTCPTAQICFAGGSSLLEMVFTASWW